MGNKLSQSSDTFLSTQPSSFMVLDKSVKPGFFSAIVKKKWYANLTGEDQKKLNCDNTGSRNATPSPPTTPGYQWSTDAQIYEVGTSLNWFVLGPIIAAAVLLLLGIFYMSQKGKAPQYA